MKKQYIYTICAILLLAIAVVGSTYAYFVATTNSANNSVDTNSSEFGVIYTGGTDIFGPLKLSADRTGGFNTTVHVKTIQGGVQALLNLYIDITEMTTNLSVSNVKWEVSGIKNGVEVYSNNGTFLGYNDTNNNRILIVDDYLLSEEQTDFTLYIWIDGNHTGDEIIGASFSGYISADTEHFTGQLTA